MPLILNVFGICKYALDSEHDKNVFDLEFKNKKYYFGICKDTCDLEC